MNIVITGDEGFIGSHLKTRLESEGHAVTGWDIKSGKDIGNFYLDEDTNFVIHLAAIADVRRSIAEPDLYWEENVIKTQKVQDWCEFANVPLLYASSSCIHSWGKSPYGMSKKVNELTAYRGQVGMRFTTVYGDGARDTMFMGKLQRGELTYVTEHKRDFIHVSDVVEAIHLLMSNYNNLTHPAYDIGTGESNVVKDIAELAGYNVDTSVGFGCESIDNTADITHLQSDTNWWPMVDVKKYVSNEFTL